MSQRPDDPGNGEAGAPARPVSDLLFANGGELGRVMAGWDWAATAVGPPQGWPASLRSVVRILLTSRFSMWMGWGPQLSFFYNDAYWRDTLRAKHPWALGRPALEVWAEIWHDIGPRLESVLQSGVATWDESLLLFLERSGYPEETYHTFSYSPLSDENQQVVGILCVVSEDTDRVLSERRMATLRDLAAAVAATRTEDDVIAAACEQLRGNLQDLPFSLIYLFDNAGSAQLACAAGIEAGAPAAPATIDPSDGDGNWPVGPLRDGQTVLVSDLECRFGQLPGGAWTQPPAQAVAVPFAAAQSQGPAGFLVVGLNPHRRYDDRYQGFVELLAGQISSGLVNAGLYAAERRRAEALEELDRAKTDFFANVSHEFRTPLTLIMGPVAELRSADQVDPLRLRTELDVIHRNGLRLGKLVNTLLEFSRLQEGRIQARFEPVDLAAFTAELASVFRSAVERAGLAYTVECPPLPEPVYIDRDSWEKVVLNLLSNALKFTFDGGITVALGRRDGSAVLRVADTGTGIPAEELPRLFEKFHRVERASSRSGEGSGIGLAMARELIDLHGGTITVESTPEVGTTFTVSVPLGSAHLPADQVAPPAAQVGTQVAVSAAAEPFVAEALRWLPSSVPAQSTPAQSTSAQSGDPLAAASGRVLVADDNADMREYLQRLLAPRYDVRTVADGFAALDAARAKPPDLIVSDVMMPGMDGLELLAALRGDERTARVPVLLLSARAGQESAAEGLAVGADDYLVKPFTAGELLARVGAHVQLGLLRREAEERLQLLQQATAALSASATPVEVAEAAVMQFGQLLGTLAVGVWELRETGSLEAMTLGGWGAAVQRDWISLPLDAPVPVADAARRGEPVWLESAEDWQRHYPHHRELIHSYGCASAAVLPLTSGSRCHGVIAIGFTDERVLSPAERIAALALADQCAAALERARLYQAEHDIAQTLQRSLLPQRLPELNRLALAARYLPGARDVAAGGDWYDVLALDGRRVAIVVGDVVGQGAAAAAVMGQLRTALATALLHGDSPGAALEHLDRVAARIPGALASTAAAMILDVGSGQLCWAGAGHLPPLVIEPERARYLTEGTGGVLGISNRSPYPDAVTRIEPGACLVLYTDGLIERRGQVIDEGLDHLAAIAAELGGVPPDALLDGLLARALPDTGPADDIALIAARYLPAPLHLRLPADPAELSALRRAVRSWTRTAAVPIVQGQDLLIALGEAATNAVEHAYPAGGDAGEFTCDLTWRSSDGAIEVEVRDFGRWRPEPPGNQHRGRGLAMIRDIATDVVVDPSPTGTHVRFHLPPPPPDTEPPVPARQSQTESPVPAAPAELHVHPQPDGGRRLELSGELDLAGAGTLRARLLDQLSAPGPVILDLRNLSYLSSAGVGLLIEAAQHAATQHTPLQVQLTSHSLVARILALTGLDHTLSVAP